MENQHQYQVDQRVLDLEIYRRKDELTIEEIRRQQDVMNKIGRWLPNCIWVDTEKGISETVGQTLTLMLSAMSKRNICA